MADGKPLNGWLLVGAIAALGAAAAAQTPATESAPQCSASPDQLAQERRLATSFFTPGATLEQRTALLAPDYIQHNPRFRKFAEEHHLDDNAAFVAMAKAGQLGRQPSLAPGAPPPPPGDPVAIVLAQCDLVTVIHKTYRHDPDAPIGVWYEYFSFDTFRVKDGKLAEHWDNATVTPP
jgi:predicted SnoaL-like aldol condensation-catalyzing enzyme